jgi:hypothetical protein
MVLWVALGSLGKAASKRLAMTKEEGRRMRWLAWMAVAAAAHERRAFSQQKFRLHGDG